MKHLAVVAVLLAVWAAAAVAQDVVDWRDASGCVGRVCTVRGKVAATEARGNVVHLYFDAGRRDIGVALIRGWFSNFPESADEYYRGKEITATGRVRRFHEQIEVVVRDRDDVKRMHQPTAPAAATAPANVQTEIEALRARVRDLEDRVEQLEHHRAP